MEERNALVTPNGNIIDISELSPESQTFVQNLYARVTPEFSITGHGHAMMMLANSTIAIETMENDPAKKAAYLKQLALEIIQKHGLQIVPLMKDELRFAISDEDIASLGLE